MNLTAPSGDDNETSNAFDDAEQIGELNCKLKLKFLIIIC